MKKHNSHGFSVVAIFLLIAVIAAITFIGYSVMNKADSKTQNTVKTPTNSQVSTEADIELQNIGLASMDSVEINRFAVSEYKSNGLKGFYIFGDKLSGGRTNPNFEFSSVKQGTKVVSAIDGVVAFIKNQDESNDSEVFIQPKNGSAWTVGYDHIVKLAVNKGDSIKAGDVIGEPAVQNNGLYRFEIQINKDADGTTTHYCPSMLLASDVKEKILGDLTTMQNSWESTTGLELYDISAQKPVGCTRETMSPSQADGSKPL